MVTFETVMEIKMRFTVLKRGYRLAELVLMHEPLARMLWCG
ncbi:putative transposase [Escherichia coli P0298942.7]|nr:putative transposase [Escherichia coli P0298942.7]